MLMTRMLVTETKADKQFIYPSLIHFIYTNPTNQRGALDV